MKIIADDIRTRVSLTRLLMKIDQHPEYSRKLGVENSSHFRSGAIIEKKESEATC